MLRNTAKENLRSGGVIIGPIVGSVIYTMLQAVVKMYTVYWPLSIGTVILLIVLFAPGGILGIVERRLRAEPFRCFGEGVGKRREGSRCRGLARRRRHALGRPRRLGRQRLGRRNLALFPWRHTRLLRRPLGLLAPRAPQRKQKKQTERRHARLTDRNGL